MKVTQVSVTYGELRSTGFPSFSNKRYEVQLSAELTTGDTAEEVRRKLTDKAKSLVKREFGDKDVEGQTEFDLPF